MSELINFLKNEPDRKQNIRETWVANNGVI